MALTIKQPQEWETFNIFPPIPQRATARGHSIRKGGFTAAVQYIYVCTAAPPPPEEHLEAIESLQAITQGIDNQRYDMDGLEK